MQLFGPAKDLGRGAFVHFDPLLASPKIKYRFWGRNNGSANFPKIKYRFWMTDNTQLNNCSLHTKLPYFLPHPCSLDGEGREGVFSLQLYVSENFFERNHRRIALINRPVWRLKAGLGLAQQHGQQIIPQNQPGVVFDGFKKTLVYLPGLPR